jgi:hypothetical protein
MSLLTVLGMRYAWATVKGNGGPSRNRKAGTSKSLWSRGECQDEIFAPILGRSHEPHRIRLEHLQQLSVDAWSHAHNQPARTAQLHNQNQRFLFIQRRGRPAEIIHLSRPTPSPRQTTAQSRDLIMAHVRLGVPFFGETKTPLRVPYGILNGWGQAREAQPPCPRPSCSPLLPDALRGR